MYLHYNIGNLYHRTAGFCAGVSKRSAWWATERVTEAICQFRAEYVRLPTNDQKDQMAQRMLDRFHLPRFAFAVDCVLAKFEKAPCGIPQGTVKQDYWNRKQCYAINC